MIARDMQSYGYYTYGAPNASGQRVLIKDEAGEPLVQGSVQMAIYLTSQAIQDNINYKDCSYIGLTYDSTITEATVIQYQNEKLKVQYVNPMGKLKQVFLRRI